MALFGLVWSIWKSRNAVIFEKKCWDAKQIFEEALVLIGQWCRFKWPNNCWSALDFARCPTALIVNGLYGLHRRISYVRIIVFCCKRVT
ncbi:hypothetical protein GQ457_16G021270 [Hibiscus cannabinus]